MFLFCFSSVLAEFQDVNVIVILGFGFLGTFLVRYGFSASGFNLLAAVTATQWAIVLNGIESIYYRGTARINLKRWVKVVTDVIPPPPPQCVANPKCTTIIINVFS